MTLTENRKELIQSHIDKLFSNLQKGWDVRNRLFIATTILSIILIGISSGALSEISNITAGGLNVKVSITVLVCVGIFGLTVLFGALSTIDLHNDTIRKEIIRLYNSIGYDDEGLLDIERTPLINPHYIDAAIHTIFIREKPSSWFIRANDTIENILASITLVLLPIGAQIVASIWVAAQYSWHWLPLIGALVCILTNVLVIVASLLRMRI